MKNGFTLVELSIVLVIIGLLIGGILVGQSLIGAAQLNRFVSDLSQYEIASSQFFRKFKKYPGDSPHFTPPGDDDKAISINYGCGTGGNTAYSNSEVLQFWPHLSQAKMLSKNYAIYSPDSCAGGIHTEQTQYTGKIGPYTKVDAAIFQPLNPINLATEKAPIIVGKDSAGNIYFNFYTTPVDALALEGKFGVQSYNSSGKQVGLVTSLGIHQCLTNVFMGGTTNCGSPNAGIGYFYYFLAPIN